MGLRYRKSVKFPGGFRMNFSKSGVGYSWGSRFYRVTKTANGRTRKTVTIPGTGVSYVEESKTAGTARKQNTGGSQPNKSPIGCLTLILIVFGAIAVTALIGLGLSAFLGTLKNDPDNLQEPNPTQSSVTVQSPSDSKVQNTKEDQTSLQERASEFLSEQFQLDVIDLQDRTLRYEITVTADGISDRENQSAAPDDWDNFLLDFISAQALVSDELNISSMNTMLYLVDSNGETILSARNGIIIENRYKEKKDPVTSGDKPSDPIVWITSSGKKYHYSSTCSGMNNPRSISVSEAKSKGYTACNKCA